MQYSDELIQQELNRYSITNSLDISENEIKWKDTFVSLDNEKVKKALEYVKGRSWYWNRLMQSIEMSQTSTVDEVMKQIETLRILPPEFEIGIQVAMRMLGNPIKDPKKIEKVKEIENKKIEATKSVEQSKPNKNRKKKV